MKVATEHCLKGLKESKVGKERKTWRGQERWMKGSYNVEKVEWLWLCVCMCVKWKVREWDTELWELRLVYMKEEYAITVWYK